MIDDINLLDPVEYHEVALQVSICLIYIMFIDFVITPHIKATNIRWIFLHIWINLVVTVFTAYDTFICLSDPDRCFTERWSNSIPYMMGVVSHVYHLAAFKNLKFDDYLHHLTMAVLCAYFCWNYLQSRCINYGLFGLTGLPGGIDYVLLTLVKTGYIDKMVEKRFNVYNQVWFRNMFLQFGIGMFWYAFIKGKLNLMGVILASFTLWNGHYYMHGTLASFYSKHYKKPKVTPELDDSTETPITIPVRVPLNMENEEDYDFEFSSDD